MKNQDLRNIVLINFAMLCISTSGALGRYIDLPPPLTIWCRAAFALLFLGVFCWWKKYPLRFSLAKHGFLILLTGVLLTVHWVSYFYALQWSNVAIGMLSLFCYPILTTLLEPIFFKTKFQKIHLLLGGIILLGIYFLVPNFDLEDGMTQGLLMGLLSAVSYAIRNLILKAKIETFNGSSLMFYQMVVMLVLLFPVIFYYETATVTSQLPFLIFLGLITTAVGHTLFLNSFKHFSISTASIMSSMQPIFGIIIAMIFLQEMPSWRSLIGGTLILLTVIVESLRSVKSKNKN